MVILVLLSPPWLPRPVARGQGEGDEPPADLARRTAAELKKTLQEINSLPKEKLDAVSAERQAALRLLKSYRYLVGVPYANVVLDDELNRYSQAAARLCQKIGRLDHHPKNPGLPEEEYQVALKGVVSSNLHWGGGPRTGNMVAGVQSFMDEPGPANAETLGHRRWCLNPYLRKVGFGRAGQFVAMWCFDRSQEKVPDFDFVGYPCPGLMPLEFFRPSSCWSVSLNPKKYQPPPDATEARIYPADKEGTKKGPALTLNHHKVDRLGFGLGNVIIFRPAASAVAPGKRYVVEIGGLMRADGAVAEVLRFPVELIVLSNVR
jgi:hypothetical protein